MWAAPLVTNFGATIEQFLKENFSISTKARVKDAINIVGCLHEEAQAKKQNTVIETIKDKEDIEYLKQPTPS